MKNMYYKFFILKGEKKLLEEAYRCEDEEFGAAALICIHVEIKYLIYSDNISFHRCICFT